MNATRGVRTVGRCLRFTVSLTAALAVGLALTVTAGAAEPLTRTRLVGRSFDAEVHFDAIEVAAVAPGAGDTLYVGGRWHPTAGGDFVGVVALGPDGEYRGRFGDCELPPTFEPFSIETITGIAFDARLNRVWVSGSWTADDAPGFSGAVCYSPNGSYIMKATGMNSTFPARSVQDVDVSDADSTVYLAGKWLWMYGGPAAQGVVVMGPAGNYLNLVGAVDTSFPDAEREWDAARTNGVAWAPNNLVYAGGTWLDGSAPAWIGALGFAPSGPWAQDLARSIRVGELSAVEVGDVDADTRSNALVAARWSGSAGSVCAVGRFTEDGVYVDDFGDELVLDGVVSHASTITAVASDRDLAPVFDGIADQQVIERRPLSFSVSARDAFEYYVAGTWAAPGMPNVRGVAVYTGRGEPDDLIYSATDLPAGASFDPVTRTLSWTPSRAQVGHHTVTLCASDGRNETRIPVSITVAANSVPVPTAPTAAATEEIPSAVTLSATDADGDPVVFEVVSLPAHGAISGTPPNLVYTGDRDFFGPDSLTYRTGDGWDWCAPQTLTISVDNVDDPPIVRVLADAVTVPEGQIARMSGTWSDPDNESVTIAAAPGGDVVVNADGTFEWSGLAVDGPETGGPVTLLYSDECGEDIFRCGFSVDILPLPPVLSDVVGPVGPVPLGSAALVTGRLTDPGTLCPHSGTVTWGDGMSTPMNITEAAGLGSFTSSHVYASAGVYPIAVMCSDDDGQSTQAAVGWAVVYDPQGGFVTGGGWLDSPPGAYTPQDATDFDMAGRAHFAFEAKYLRGATAPVGKTAFWFQTDSFRFNSTDYQWLVVAGSKAQFKGTGRVNDQGHYGFMLTAIDGGARGADRFRMKIVDIATGVVVYDNQCGAADTDDPSCQIAGGSIIVHAK